MKKNILFLAIFFAGIIAIFFMQGCAYDDQYERRGIYDDRAYYGNPGYYGDDRREYREHRYDRDDEGEHHWWHRDDD